LPELQDPDEDGVELATGENKLRLFGERRLAPKDVDHVVVLKRKFSKQLAVVGEGEIAAAAQLQLELTNWLVQRERDLLV